MRAACSLSYLEPAPLSLGPEMKLVLGSAPPPVASAGRSLGAHWDCPPSGPEQSDWPYTDLGFLEELCFCPWPWAVEAAEAEERVGVTAESTSRWKRVP